MLTENAWLVVGQKPIANAATPSDARALFIFDIFLSKKMMVEKISRSQEARIYHSNIRNMLFTLLMFCFTENTKVIRVKKVDI